MITPVSSVRDRRIYVDSDVSMQSAVAKPYWADSDMPSYAEFAVFIGSYYAGTESLVVSSVLAL